MNAITEYIGLGTYNDWEEPQRIEFLVRELENRRPLVPADLTADALVKRIEIPLSWSEQVAQLQP